jgi:tRNA(fMet)-specific endonuclease VapC
VKYLLDTDHLSVLQQQSGPDYLALSARIAAHPRSDLALSIISFHEQVLGCHTYINRARTAADVVRGYRIFSRLLSDYAAVAVVPFDSGAAMVYERLQADRIRISTMDLRIASIALDRGLILVTRNLRDLRHVPGLVTEDWTASDRAGGTD